MNIALDDASIEGAVAFILDGAEVTALPGETLWQVAQRIGTDIPHLCWADEPGYRSDGNCRACMVEVEGERTLVASCIREPAAGMVVTTNSQRAERARKLVVELLAVDQPPRDKAHDASAHFWKTVDAAGVDELRFPRIDLARLPAEDASHVAMRVNLDACIHCTPYWRTSSGNRLGCGWHRRHGQDRSQCPLGVPVLRCWLPAELQGTRREDRVG